MTRRETDHRPPARTTFELSNPFRNSYAQYLPNGSYPVAEMQIKALHDQFTVRDLARIFLTNTHDEPGRLIFASATLIHGIDPEKLESEFAEIYDLFRSTFRYSHNPNNARYLFELANETDISLMHWMIKDIQLADRHLGEYPFRHSGPPLEYADLLRLETDLKHRKVLRAKLRELK